MWGRQERRQVHRGRKKANGSNGKGGRERGGIGHVAVLGRAPEGARTQRWGKARKRLKEENRRECFFLSQVRASESGQIGRGSQRGTKVRKTRFAPGNILLRDRFMSEHRHVSLRECPGLSMTAPRPHAVGDVRNSAGLRARQSRKLL